MRTRPLQQPSPTWSAAPEGARRPPRAAGPRATGAETEVPVRPDPERLAVNSSQESDLDRRLARDPIAIVGLSALYPKSSNLQEFWANVVVGRRLHRRCARGPLATSTTTTTPTPRAPDKTYSTRGGFIPDVPFDPLEFGLPPNTLEVTDVTPAAQPGRRPRPAQGRRHARRPPFDRQRTGVVLGITGANQLIQPLTARLQTPVLKEVVAQLRTDRRGRRGDRRQVPPRLRAVAGELVPGPARQRRRRPDRQPARPRRHQLRRRRRLRQLARRRPHWPSSSCAAGRSDMVLTGGVRHVQRHLHVPVLQQDPGAVADRATSARSTPTATARCSARASACSCSSASPTPSATATGSTR